MPYWEDLVNFAKEKNIRELPAEECASFVEKQTPVDYDADIARRAEEALDGVLPDYQQLSPEQKQSRKELHTLAKQHTARATAQLIAGLNNISTDDLGNGVETLFYGMGNAPEQIAEKQALHDLLTGADKDRLHDVFLNTMNRLASFPAEDFLKMSPAQQLELLPTAFPLMAQAKTGASLLQFFQGKECGITQAEADLFTDLYSSFQSVTSKINQKLDIWMNPYYPEVDFSQVPADSDMQNRLDSTFSTYVFRGIESDSSVNALRDAEKQYRQVLHNDIRDSAKSILTADKPLEENEAIDYCDAAGNILYDSFDAQQRLQEGQIVYFTRSRYNFYEGANMATGEPIAFRDFGDGKIRQISPQQAKALEKAPQPSRIARFFHNVIRAFGGKGLDAVNRYDNYPETVARIADECKNTPAISDAFRTAAKKVRDYSAEKSASKATGTEKQVENVSAEKPLTREERGREIARKHMLGGEKHPLTSEDKKWTWDNPDAVRQGFETCKQEYLSALKAPYTPQQQVHIEKFDKNIEALTAFINGEMKKNDVPDVQLSNAAPEKQEHIEALKKQKDPLMKQ